MLNCGLNPVAAALLFATVSVTLAQAQGFTTSAAWFRADGKDALRLELGIPDQHKIYSDSVRFLGLPDGVTVTPQSGNPEPERHFDPLIGATSVAYTASVRLDYVLQDAAALSSLDFSVEYSGCSAKLCFPPKRQRFSLTPNAHDAQPGAPELAAPPSGIDARFAGFDVAGRLFGYEDAGPFVTFLNAARAGKAQEQNPLAALFDRNLLLFALAILGGGLLLNLTPCVLPMIPINLAIIGAGSHAASRRRGFLLGGTYGLGITAAYGALGLVSVLTGSAFGLLQSSPWFNGAVATVFLALALALFDVWTVDLSRFQRVGAPTGAGSFGTAFAVGAISALLAGACVAPVLIWTLLLAANLHQTGNPLGIALPFLLGLGMALPWPFAGAGLSFLPKPGAWMNRIKQAFGVLVLVFAFHYAQTAWQSLHPATSAAHDSPIAWRPSLEAALAESRRTRQPVFIDLWATWCSACRKMDRTTLRDPRVVKALADFIPAHVQCERLRDPDTAALLRALGAGGLPTFVVLRPTAP